MPQRPYVSPDGQAVGSIEHDPNCSHPRQGLKKTGECGDGCCDEYQCGACGKVFRFEWPD